MGVLWASEEGLLDSERGICRRGLGGFGGEVQATKRLCSDQLTRHRSRYLCRQATPQSVCDFRGPFACAKGLHSSDFSDKSLSHQDRELQAVSVASLTVVPRSPLCVAYMPQTILSHRQHTVKEGAGTRQASRRARLATLTSSTWTQDGEE